MIKNLSRAFLCLSTFMAFSFNANASLTPVEQYTLVSSDVLPGNDCNAYNDTVDGEAGVGGSNLDNCNIFYYGDNDERIEISPVIRKFEVDGNQTEEGGTYAGETSADDWTFNGDDGLDSRSEGSWVYDDSSSVYIRYWAVKAGNGHNGGFKLFWYVSNEDYTSNCTGNAFNLACLSAALTTNNGTWATPNSDTKDDNLSHITFFNSRNPIIITEVPEPSTLAIFALGVLGLSLSRKKA